MAEFEPAFQHTLKWEGGYVNNPDDPGGETKYGISKRAFPKENIANLTRDRAEALYRMNYWTPLGLALVAPQQVANKVFDLAVNLGAKRGVRLAQRAVNFLEPARLAEDGVLGPKTRKAFLDFPERCLLASLRMTAAMFYLDLGESMPQFVHGWLRRALD